MKYTERPLVDTINESYNQKDDCFLVSFLAGGSVLETFKIPSLNLVTGEDLPYWLCFELFPKGCRENLVRDYNMMLERYNRSKHLC